MTTNINKTELSETDIITKFILPAIKESRTTQLCLTDTIVEQAV